MDSITKQKFLNPPLSVFTDINVADQCERQFANALPVLPFGHAPHGWNFKFPNERAAEAKAA
jgi:hypothetical protein